MWVDKIFQLEHRDSLKKSQIGYLQVVHLKHHYEEWEWKWLEYPCRENTNQRK